MSDTASAGNYFGHLPPAFVLPSPEEIFDSVMAQIEPELTTAQYPQLEARYANETPEESKTRRERYERAFFAYDEKFRQYRREVEERSHAHQRAVLKSTEDRIRNAEDERLRTLEAQLAS